MRYEEVDHPTHLLYLDRVTGVHYTPVPGPGGVQLRRVRFVPKRKEPLLLEAPKTEQLLQIPRYSTMREEERVPSVRGEAPQTDFTGQAIEQFKKIPIEFRIVICLIILLSVFSSMVVVSHPKIVQSIIPALAPPPVTQPQSGKLQRISQLDPGQYDSGQFDPYSPSACSAASMTEVFNSYGSHYRIADILSVEINLGVITPSAGLTDISGISRTANRFGFETQLLSGLDQAIDTANNGTPVIVDILPGVAWPGGHFVDVKGGDGDNVTLVDSWSTNYQTIAKSRFLNWGLGSMWKISPSKYSLLQGHPTLSADQVNAVLAANQSPAARSGESIYSMSQAYGIDDAYILATFAHESTWGKAGVARESKSPGNLRCPIPDWTGGWCQDNYEHFHSWQDGFKSLYILLSGSHYSGAGNNTPERIIPIFAPQADNNDESAYIASIKHAEDILRSGGTQI